MLTNQGATNYDELVSVIMVSYNKKDAIEESIKSVQAQTYQNWELLIEDDQSKDGTIALLMDYLRTDKRLRIYQTSQRRGAGKNRSSVLGEAKGRWVAFLECGDTWKPNKLERQVAFMKENGYLFSYTACKKVIGGKAADVSGPETVSYDMMKKFCWLNHSTVMYNLKETGVSRIRCSNDNNYYALWLQVSKKADCHLLNEGLATVGKNRKKKFMWLKKKFRWRYEVYRIVEERNQIVSAYMTLRNLWYTALYRYKNWNK